MITFVTLFLGLTFGLQEVVVQVGSEVAAVELRLDDTVVGRVEGEPWRFEVDFGDPVPHELVAVVLDEQGQELDRARQWINLPPPPAELSVFLEAPAGDGSRVARVSWESTVGSKPISAQASFDGQAIAITDPSRIQLPPHDPESTHLLRVQIDFTPEVSAVEEMVLGGGFSEETSSEMTAVLVRSRKDLRDGRGLEGLLSVAGRPLEVVAVDRGTAEVVVVPDSGYFGKDLWRLVEALGKKKSTASAPQKLSKREMLITGQQPEEFEFENSRQRSEQKRAMLRTGWSFDEADYLRLIWPVPLEQESAGGSYRVFLPSPAFDAGKFGLFWILTGMDSTRQPAGEQRLTDAVAAAALKAVRQNGRRAVVLLLSSKPVDESELTPKAIRGYLQSLQVPLYVWWPGKKRAMPKEEWGRVVSMDAPGELAEALDEIDSELDKQWVVWVSGLHLPNRVQLDPKAQDMTLVN